MVDQPRSMLGSMRLPKGKIPLRPYALKVREDLLAEARQMADAYGISFNMLVNLLLDKATTDWEVPGLNRRDKPTEQQEARETEKDLT